MLFKRELRKIIPKYRSVLALVFLLAITIQPSDAVAQQAVTESTVTASKATDDELPTFLDEVTVTATMNPSPVRDTPGVVSVIDSETIAERMLENFSDLVKFEPGVYIESDVTRL